MPKSFATEDSNNVDCYMDCNHIQLSKFGSVFDKRFTRFTSDFTALLMDAMREQSSLPPLQILSPPLSPILQPSIPIVPTPTPAPPSPPPPPPPGPDPIPLPAPSPGPPPVTPGPRKDPEADPRRYNTQLTNGAEDRYRYWDRRSQAEDYKTKRVAFLSSLNGWSSENTGPDILVAAGTCNWFKDVKFFKSWMSDPACGTFVYLGARGQGKTYLAKAVTNYLVQTHKADRIISFFCTPGQKQPAVWEYITWSLISQYPAWFDHVPARYHERNDKSPRLSMGDWVDIWMGLRAAWTTCDIYIIIDGLEQAGEEFFKDSFELISQLRQFPITMMPMNSMFQSPQRSVAQPLLKVFLTCSMTPAVLSASAVTSRCSMDVDETDEDIARFVDTRLNRLIDGNEVKGAALASTRQSIKDKSCAYWRFAKFAVDEVEKTATLEGKTAIDYEGYIPAALKDWVRGQILPVLQSVGNDGHVRTALALITYLEPITIAELEDILNCLHGVDVMRDISVPDMVREYFSNLIVINTQSVAIYVHNSVRDFMLQYFPLDQQAKFLTHAFLTYLSQDQFSKRLPLSWTSRDDCSQWLDKEYPFHSMAADRWLPMLRDVKEVDEKLEPLLGEFLQVGSPHFDSWKCWTMWRRKEPQHVAETIDYSVMPLLAADCPVILQHFLPVPGSHQPEEITWKTWASSLPSKAKALSLSPSPEKKVYRFAPPGWPNTRNYSGRPALTAASTGSCLDYILQWHPDIEARDATGATALSHAIRANGTDEHVKISACRKLLSHGAKVNTCDQDGVSPLIHACEEKSLPLVRILIDHGASVNTSDFIGTTPLEAAYSNKWVDIMHELLRNGADPDQWWQRGRMALVQCCYDDYRDLFAELLQYADVNVRDSSGLAVIHHIAKDREVPTVFMRLLLGRRDLDLNQLDTPWRGSFDRKRELKSAVCHAAASGNYEVLEMLLEAGASPDRLSGMKFSPLYYAVGKRKPDLVRLLIRHQAIINTQLATTGTFLGDMTALGCAVEKGSLEIVSLLLEQGADATFENGCDMEGPLHLALDKEKLEKQLVEVLLQSKHPPDINFVPPEGNHVLTEAVRINNLELLQLLIAYGSDIDKEIWFGKGLLGPMHLAVRNGYTDICRALLDWEPRYLDWMSDKDVDIKPPLHVAIEKGKIDVARFFLERGANPRLQSHWFEESALHEAIYAKEPKLVELLLEAAPDMVNVPTERGWTPLIWACDIGDLGIIEMLLKAGADIYHFDSYGFTCVTNDLFCSEPEKRIDKILEMLVKYGLDVNAVVDAGGHTVLGAAIIRGTIKDVQWILEHGGDASRCQRHTKDSDQWRTAMQVAIGMGHGKMLEFLLQPQWGLREHLGHADWHGFMLLDLPMPSRLSYKVNLILFHVSEEMRKATGIDHFANAMNHPTLAGYTPLDYALGARGTHPSSRSRVLKETVFLIEAYLGDSKNDLVLDEAACMLCSINEGWEDEASRIFTALVSKVLHDWEGSTCKRGSVAAWQCQRCEEDVHEVQFTCKMCFKVHCAECKDKMGCEDLHGHEWLKVDIDETRNSRAPEFKTWLKELQQRLSARVEELEAAEQIITKVSEDEEASERGETTEEQALQSALQLATLHAFGYLAIRRPFLSLHLPLHASIEQQIAPFKSLIHHQRQYIERRNLEIETFGFQRRLEEWRYMKRGLLTPYVDEGLVKADMMLIELRTLFDVGIERGRPNRRRGPRRSSSLSSTRSSRSRGEGSPVRIGFPSRSGSRGRYDSRSRGRPTVRPLSRPVIRIPSWSRSRSRSRSRGRGRGRTLSRGRSFSRVSMRTAISIRSTSRPPRRRNPFLPSLSRSPRPRPPFHHQRQRPQSRLGYASRSRSVSRPRPRSRGRIFSPPESPISRGYPHRDGYFSRSNSSGSRDGSIGSGRGRDEYRSRSGSRERYREFERSLSRERVIARDLD